MYLMADFNLILLQMVEDCKTNFSGNLLFKTRNVYIVAFAQNKFVNNDLIFECQNQHEPTILQNKKISTVKPV